MSVDPKTEAQQVNSLREWRAKRNNKDVQNALESLYQVAIEEKNIDIQKEVTPFHPPLIWSNIS